MRKIGLLTTLTLGIMMVFSTAVMAATAVVPTIHFDSPTNQVIHSAYSKTSDACASCHSPHQALNGDSNLLKFADVSAACMGCHDGTVATTYNVVAGTHSGSVPNSGGLFGVAGATRTTVPGLSKHAVTSDITTSVAPGGNHAGGKDLNGDWGTEFNCVACHNPHGAGGNFRSLNPDVNNIATQQRVATGVVLTTTDSLTYKATKGAWLTGHGYDAVVMANTVAAPTVFATITKGFKVDTVNGQIIFDVAQPGITVKAAYSPGLVVKADIANKLTATESVKYQSGMNQFCGACHTDYNNVGKTITTDKNGVTTTGNTGGAYNDLIGEYSQAYRHSVGYTRTATTADPNFNDPNSLIATYPGLVFDKSNAGKATVTCLTCHYAHGTSDAFITANLAKQLGPDNVFNGTNATGSKLIQTYDLGRSSALKRLPNMGVCQQCHNKQ